MSNEEIIYDTDELRELHKLKAELIGQKVVRAVAWNDSDDPLDDGFAEGRLELDNGTHLYVNPNEGCGGCPEGWYEIRSLGNVNNAIMSVEATQDDIEKFQIFVYAASPSMKYQETLIEVTGSDNGYYGTGFTITVKREAQL